MDYGIKIYTYPATVWLQDALVVIIVVFWIIDEGADVYPSHNKDPSCSKAGKFSTAVVAFNIL